MFGHIIFSYWSLAFILCFLILCFMVCVFIVILFYSDCLFACLFVLQRENERAWSWVDGEVGRSARSWGKGNHDQNTCYGGKFSIEKNVKIIKLRTQLHTSKDRRGHIFWI